MPPVAEVAVMVDTEPPPMPMRALSGDEAEAGVKGVIPVTAMLESVTFPLLLADPRKAAETMP